MTTLRATRDGTSEASLTQQWATQTPTDDEAADVALAREGDRDAFERLYRRHVAKIYGMARRMAGDAADDLTQDAFVRAWEKLHTFRGEARFGTWLYRLAVNVVLEDRRKARARGWREVEDGTTIGCVPVPPADTPLAVDLAAAVKRLPEAARQVFLLHDVEGFKHHEIGRLVGIKTGTSKGQLHRARMILRRYLGGKNARTRSRAHGDDEEC